MLDEGLFNINNITLGPLKTKLSSEIIDFYVDETILKACDVIKICPWVIVNRMEYREN